MFLPFCTLPTGRVSASTHRALSHHAVLRTYHALDLVVLIAEVDAAFEDRFQIGEVKRPAFAAADVDVEPFVRSDAFLRKLDDLFAFFA